MVLVRLCEYGTTVRILCRRQKPGLVNCEWDRGTHHLEQNAYVSVVVGMYVSLVLPWLRTQ
jgi:hypothetical protein